MTIITVSFLINQSDKITNKTFNFTVLARRDREYSQGNIII